MSEPRSIRTHRGLACAVGLLLAVFLLACDKAGDMSILDVNPRVGSTAGDQIVQIMGKNFRQDIGYTIYFGTKKVTTLTIRDPETIELLTPPGVAEGKVDIMIRADNGNAFRIPGVFTFQSPAGAGAGGPKKEEKGNLAY
ncbi:MAG: IPT/TIG domain-containing protein [Polyangiales bacterium]